MFSTKIFFLLAGVVLILSQAVTGYAGTDLNQQIDILADKLASTSKADVVKGNETQVYIAIGQNDGVLPGNKFEIVRLGEALKIGDEIIGYEETAVAEVEVTRAREKVSICKVLSKTVVPKAGDKAHQLRKAINSLVVGQFSYNQSFNRLTKSLQEKLVTAMAGKGMQVVERDQLERVLKEQKLGYSGLINTNSAKKIGQLLGADGMLLGAINDMGNSITINARLVDMETGKTVSASEVELPKTPLIAQLLDIPVEDKPFMPQPIEGKVKPGLAKQDKIVLAQSADGFTIALKGCRKSGSSIKCNLMITNNEMDKEIYFNKSRLFDNLGNTYEANTKKIGNRGTSWIRMVKGIPTKASVSFTGIDSDAEYAALIELTFGGINLALQFRDVTFTK